ncbi:hypothetical protein AB1Y20_007288 [Prymnesium parvum]|uniref:Uncharacterized protein n=1 Tax=Prymnesium parvum TaxID=97485 RepID=A0AB34IWM4_PRYPA
MRLERFQEIPMMEGFCPTTNSGTAMYFFLACSVSVAVFGFTTRRSVLLGGSALTAVLATHQMWLCHVPSSLWGHSLSGTALLRGAGTILHSDSGLLQMNAIAGLFGSILFLSIIIGEALTTWMHFFHNYVHDAMYAIGMLLCFCAAYEDYWGRRSASAAEAAHVRRRRHLLEPPLWAALALLLISHVHDNSRIIKLSHFVLGYMILGLCALQVVSAVVCDASRARSLPFVLRALNAFAWLLPGVWLLHMCFFFYLFRDPKGGLHDWLMAAAPQMNSDAEVNALEAISFYLAVCLILCGAVLACLIRKDSPPSASARREVSDDGSYGGGSSWAARESDAVDRAHAKTHGGANGSAACGAAMCQEESERTPCICAADASSVGQSAV